MFQYESYLSSRPAQPSQWWGGLVAGVMQVDSCAELDVGARHGTARQLLAGWAGAAVTAWQLAVVCPVQVSSCNVLHPARGGARRGRY